jgi:hypothetical protein
MTTPEPASQVDAKTDELRDAHDALAEMYASRLAHVMDRLPADRAVLGTGFDVYWLSPAQMQRYVTDAGFSVTFWAGRPADPDEHQPQGYLIAQRL